jgi:hypothetical protein
MLTRLLAVLTCLALLAPAARAADAQTQKFTGPYTHENLTIYLVHGPETAKGEYITLEEALAAKKVIVHETGDVNELAIENKSNDVVFVQSGDIVKGGRQDRTIGCDLVLAPHSKKIPIASFCVEHGRWTGRGNGESAALFSSSSDVIAGAKMKLAANSSYNGGQQQKVWDEVASNQRKLASNVASAQPAAAPAAPAVSTPPPPAPDAVAEARPANPDLDRQVTRQINAEPNAPAAPVEEAATAIAGGSGGSFQLTLESKDVQQAVDKYVETIKSAAAQRHDDEEAIGYIAVINGQFACSDVYGSNALFKKLWPKMLKSAAAEAAAEKKADGKFEPLSEDGVRAALASAEDGKTSNKKVNARTNVTTIETAKNVTFICEDKPAAKGEAAAVHRSVLPLAKDDK